MAAAVVVREVTTSEERAWCNERYRELRFAETAAGDLQLVAELDGARVGLGRLVELGDAVELGGIWTHESVRKRGVASAVVVDLMKRAAGRSLWCVPYRGHTDFYCGFGMHRAEQPWHDKIVAKVEDCRTRGLWPVDVLRGNSTT